MSSEESLIWGASFMVVAFILVLSLVAFWSRTRRDRKRLEEAASLGINRARAQYPFVDPARCIGCGTCVKACPEGDVLGVVGGTAVVINGLRCVGHARCEELCPVGALEVGLGDLKGRADIPLLTEDYESTVPDLFVIGELGGLSLIYNAFDQGARAVAKIADRLHSRPRPVSSEVLDLLIVGAGPAGISAALKAKEQGLSYVVLEKEQGLGGTILSYPRRKLVLTRPSELPLHGRMRKEEYTKEELLELLQEILDQQSLHVVFGAEVRNVSNNGRTFNVQSVAGAYQARCVVLALGRRGSPRKLGVPGEERSKVMYQLRDAESYRGEKILCVGGGDSAVEAAIGLGRQPGSSVTISYRKDNFYRIKKKNQDRLAKLVRRGKVRPLMSSRVLEIGPKTVRLEADGREVILENDYVLIFIGSEPPYPLLHNAGVAFGGEPSKGFQADSSALSSKPS